MPAFASGKHAAGICDRCGLRYRYLELSEQLEDGKRTGLIVCRRCNDRDNEQLYVGRYMTVEGEALRNPRAEANLRAIRTFSGFNPVVGFEMTTAVGKASAA